MGTIRRVAVLGSGVMGAGIAAHLANAGIDCLLYDLPTGEAGASAKERSSIAHKGIVAATKAKPASFFQPALASRITPCNYDDDGAKLADCDWIVEVVVERLDIKRSVYEWVAKHRSEGSIVSSNTSGIPLSDLSAEMPAEMRAHFLITHFFNPVRYMRLLEIVSGPDTREDVVATMATFVDRVLGKGVVYAKDTPNFIANRIGTYGMASVFRTMAERGLSIETVDAVFGPAMGRPKSAVFRTCDLVGLDTLQHVFTNLYAYLEHDEEREAFKLPAVVESLIADGRVGEKSGAGFYKKTRVDGKRQIQVLDTDSLSYRPAEKPRYASMGAARKMDTLPERIEALVYGEDEAAQLAWTVLADTLIYSANRIPEIAEDIVNIDRAMCWGFGWKLGPFQTWDAIGLRRSVERMQSEGRTVPQWVLALLESGHEHFYARDPQGTQQFLNQDGGQQPVVQPEGAILLADVKASKGVVDTNASASLIDLGDGILGLEFHCKMNAIDDLLGAMYDRGLNLLEDGAFEALVVGNQDARAFCAGANLAMILMWASQGEFDEIGGLIDRLHANTQRAKHSSRPVVTAPFGLTLGGGVELSLASSATVGGSELYMGLVEAGVGLIPAGGGCKEMMFRTLGGIRQDIDYDPNPFVQKVFETIAMAKVSTSAHDAKSWGYLRPTDRIVLNPDRLVAEAKSVALGMVTAGYEPPAETTIKLPGRSGRAAIEAYLHQLHDGGYATEHDMVVGTQLANILTGGDIPAGTAVSERHLLDLEREAFLSLCGEEKTRMRMLHMLQTNKPLRN